MKLLTIDYHVVSHRLRVRAVRRHQEDVFAEVLVLVLLNRLQEHADSHLDFFQ